MVKAIRHIALAAFLLSVTTCVAATSHCMPTPSKKITSKFGHRWGRQHKGLDIKVYTGDPISAAFSGVVTTAGYNAGGYGYYVIIRHTDGFETRYGHLSRILVKCGQAVQAGHTIGLGGSTGRSTGAHLHFEIRHHGQPIDPSLLFDFPHQELLADLASYHPGMKAKDIEKLRQARLEQQRQQEASKRALAQQKQEEEKRLEHIANARLALQLPHYHITSLADTLYLLRPIATNTGTSFVSFSPAKGPNATTTTQSYQMLMKWAKLKLTHSKLLISRNHLSNNYQNATNEDVNPFFVLDSPDGVIYIIQPPPEVFHRQLSYDITFHIMPHQSYSSYLDG